LFAGIPPAVGGALAPISGALGVVTAGRCAGIPAGFDGRFGSFGEPEGVDGGGGVIRDIR
jgi:hypothetical protein